MQNEYTPTIKFSKNYRKLEDYSSGRVVKLQLLQIVKINSKEFSPEFIDYDTDKIFTIQKDTEYILLIFLKCNHRLIFETNLLTTLRTFSQDKWNYYKNLQGQNFRVKMELSNTGLKKPNLSELQHKAQTLHKSKAGLTP